MKINTFRVGDSKNWAQSRRYSELQYLWSQSIEMDGCWPKAWSGSWSGSWSWSGELL